MCQLYIREFFWSLNLSLKIELANRQVLSSRPKREFNQFHVAGRATFAKKCTKKCDIRSKVCYLNLIHFCHSFDSSWLFRCFRHRCSLNFPRFRTLPQSLSHHALKVFRSALRQKKFTEKKETITSGIEKLTLSVYQKRGPCPFAISVRRMFSNICRNNMNCTLISGR